MMRASSFELARSSLTHILAPSFPRVLDTDTGALKGLSATFGSEGFQGRGHGRNPGGCPYQHYCCQRSRLCRRLLLMLKFSNSPTSTWISLPQSPPLVLFLYQCDDRRDAVAQLRH
jgi:hypothetical protein